MSDKTGASLSEPPSRTTAVTGEALRSGSRGWLLGLLLIIATLAAYQPAWHGKRIWDDDGHLTAPELRSLNGLGRIWTEVGATQQYYPLTFTAFWVQHKLWGDATLGYHLTNILLHCLSALLFLRILRELEVPGAYLAAAIFALHPVHVESVAWMSQLKNTLSCVFYLGSALAFLGFDRTRRKALYGAALGMFMLGLLSKTAVVTLPAGMLVVLWWKRGNLSWKRDVLPVLPFFLVGLVAGLVTVWLERDLYGAKGSEFHLSMIERCLIAGRGFWFHLGKLLWPAHLLFMYPRWQISEAAWQLYLYPGAAVLLLACLWLVRRRNRGPLAGVLLFAGTLVPTLGFVSICTFRHSFVNDHHQYLASFGVIALVSAGAALASGRWPLCQRFNCRYVALALLLTLAILTWRQCRMYEDVETLWRTTLAGNPRCALAWHNMGSILLGQGRVDEAIAQFRKALDLQPHVAEVHSQLGVALAHQGRVKEAIACYRNALECRSDLAQAHFNLAHALAQEGQLDEAIAHYKWALGGEPRNGKIYSNLGHALFQKGKVDEAAGYLQQALALMPASAGAHDTLGLILLQTGQLDEAIVHFQHALQYQPDLTTAQVNLASAFLQKGQPDKAVAELSEVLRADPKNVGAHCQLAEALNVQGQTKESIQHYRAALQTRGDSPEALNNLAWILATSAEPTVRNGAEAVVLAEQACKLTDSKQAMLVGTLAAAYAEAGRFAEAVKAAEKAAALAERDEQPELAAKNRKLAECYRAGKTARGSP